MRQCTRDLQIEKKLTSVHAAVRAHAAYLDAAQFIDTNGLPLLQIDYRLLLFGAASDRCEAGAALKRNGRALLAICGRELLPNPSPIPSMRAGVASKIPARGGA